ncbi:MAG: ABC transporter ATP-binding protein [Xanthomonadales bacterium]|nr:ABC transporter ATP-binding protein [Xanthomonadales bacterium]MCC6594965.1 ABC transporter ATP-binding protein [Rhodanobacteraceae bacterium]MDL1868154.1 ABC transporter ATP-binding protein [Gammaproteobacteria bacterium PRO6]
MGEILVELEHVGVAFQAQRSIGGGRFWALEDVSLQLRRGERLGVIGRNGAGKSTLLRVLAGILVPDRGRVRRARVSCQLMSLSLGFVPYLSGRDNAVLSGLLLGLRRRDIVARLPAIREFSELGDFFEQPIATYSAGMSMRLAFAVAMQVEPDVLLIDEVLAVGDAEFQAKSGAALRQRMGDGQTVVLVSHDEKQIAERCDRVLWIEHGRSVLEGGRDEVFAAYHRAQHPAPEAA